MHSRLRAGLLGLGVALLACAPAAPPEREGPPDVWIVTLDTARGDRFLRGDGLTPAIDAWAAEGAAFRQAVSPVPLTLPAHASLLTGLDPPHHGVRSNGTFRLAAHHHTLAERLRAQGYRTGAFVGAAVLDAEYGLAQGFEVYDDDLRGGRQFAAFGYAERPGSAVVERTLAWAEALDAAPAFGWVHLFDPHKPYTPPEPEASRHRASPYDGEIAYTDRVVGELFAGLQALGRLANAFVVVTADHGESLGEHGERTHGVFVYDATLRIPLVIRGPGIVPARRDEPVSLVDVMPSVLGLLRLDADPSAPPPDGVDLSPLLRGEITGIGERHVYVESLFPELSYGWAALRGLRGGSAGGEQWKFVSGAASELYALHRDAAEQRDVAASEPARTAAFAAQLAQRYPVAEEAAAETLEMNPARRQQLEALGYFTAPRPTQRGRTPIDPRSQLEALDQMQEAVLAFQAGDAERALALTRALIARDAGNPLLHKQLAYFSYSTGDRATALASYARAVALAPTDSSLWIDNARVLEAAGRHAEAAAAYGQAADLDAGDRASRLARWRLLMRAPDANDSIERESAAWLEARPDDAEVTLLHLLARHANGPPGALLGALESAAARLPDADDLTLALAELYAQAGRREEATRAFRRVLARSPGHPRAATGLAAEQLRARDFAGARALLEPLAPAPPGDPRFFLMLAEARLQSGARGEARAALREAVRRTPELAPAWFHLGRLQLEDGEAEAAIASLERAVAAGFRPPEVWEPLRRAYERAGRPADAAKVSARAADAP